MEAKVILALLLQTFELTLPEDYEFKKGHALTAKPKGGVPCTLKLRKQ